MKHIWLITGLVLLCNFTSGQAKQLARRHIDATGFNRGRLSPDQLKVLERKFSSFLQTRKASRYFPGFQNRVLLYNPSQADLFALARQWDDISPDFKQDYIEVISIPQSMDAHVSPSGHFEVYYATSGYDSVSTVDTMGYSNAHWRQRVSGPNGVPDYVDQTAYALDSAWSMIVERFGYLEPFPYTDPNRRSSRYKVVLRNMAYGYYGIAYPLGKVPGEEIGFASYIEIRNDWSGWNLGGELNYERKPHLAAWITAVHEFFHAVQYRMVRNVNRGVELDYFPVSWLEATAVLMEDLAFPSINDYVQYTTNYFDDPGQTMLSDFYDGYDEYKNVLVAMFLYQHAPKNDSTDFIRQTFFNNFEKSITFDENLELTSEQLGVDWAQMIGEFHARSFYTGSRTGLDFLEEAQLLNSWYYHQGSADADTLQLHTVNNHAMVPISFIHTPGQGKTLKIVAKTDNTNSKSDPFFVSLILRKMDLVEQDSIIFSTLKGNDSITFEIDNWDSYHEAITIVSNTDLTNPQSLSLTHKPQLKKVGQTPIEPEKLIRGKELIESVKIFTVSGRLVSVIKNQDAAALSDSPPSLSMLAQRYRLAAGSYVLRIQRKDLQSGASSVQMKKVTVR